LPEGEINSPSFNAESYETARNVTSPPHMEEGRKKGNEEETKKKTRLCSLELNKEE
jgi:hypothetical protein